HGTLGTVDACYRCPLGAVLGGCHWYCNRRSVCPVSFRHPIGAPEGQLPRAVPRGHHGALDVRPAREIRLIKKGSLSHAHLSPEHIDELREGINTGLPQQVTHPRGLLDRRPRLSRFMHGRPKTQPPKTAPVPADALSPF